jgi:hypothetical protein
MGHEHERNAAVRRHRSEKLLEGVEAAGRGTDADNRRARPLLLSHALGRQGLGGPQLRLRAIGILSLGLLS